MERRHVISMKNAIALKNLLFYGQEQKWKTSQRGKPSQAKENIGHNLFIFAFSNMFKTKILWPVILKKRMKIELYLIAIFNFLPLTFTLNF